MDKVLYKRKLFKVSNINFTEDDFNNLLIDCYLSKKNFEENKDKLPKSAVCGEAVTIKLTPKDYRS